MSRSRVEKLELKDQLKHTLEEARMVLPGIQALFGFQMIAVFNDAFKSDLSRSEKLLHLVAISLTALSIGLSLGPAAYHRQSEPGEVSDHLVRVSTRYLTWAMLPLAAGLALDFFLVARLASGSTQVGAAMGVCLALYLAIVWFIVPHASGTRKGEAEIRAPYLEDGSTRT